MSGRRSATIALQPLLSAVAAPRPNDEVAHEILDAATAVLAANGLRRFSVEEIAERSGFGRTTIYRRFDGREQILHALIAREVHRFFTAINDAVAHVEPVADRVVDGFITGLRALEASAVPALLDREPELLSFLAGHGDELLTVARTFLVTQFARGGHAASARTEAVAELLVRLALSFVVARTSVMPLGDDERARAALHTLLDPVLR